MKRILAIATPLLLLASCSDFNAAAVNHEELKEIVMQYYELKMGSECVDNYKYRDLADQGSRVILHNPKSVQTAPSDLQRCFHEAFEDSWEKAGYSQNPYITLKKRYSSAKQGASKQGASIQATAKPKASQPEKAKQETKPARNATKHDSSKKPAQGSRKQNRAATSRPEPKKEDLYNKAKAQPEDLFFDPPQLRP